MSSRSNDVVFLFGAGASVESGIPASSTMINAIEERLENHTDWTKYLGLYHHVKSALYYSWGLRGRFGSDVPYNIEVLVNALYELERNEQHPLYPFIAAWNSRFVSLANPDFSNIREFRRRILQELKRWMCPEDPSQARYYNGLIELQRELNFPLHLFSLNYDLGIERIASENFKVESGFADFGPNFAWDWERFESSEGGPAEPPQAFLYKLHGSINWKRDPDLNLFSVDQIENVDADNMEVIFGRDFKLEAADPYLFFAYQFRRLTLLSKLIVTVGYSFADDHINKMIVQALRTDEATELCVVGNIGTNDDAERRISEIAQEIDVDRKKISVQVGTAKSFLESQNLGEKILNLIPSPTNAPF